MPEMNIIMKSHFDEFVKKFGFASKSKDDAFELFAIYCIASKYSSNQTITKTILEDVNIGNGNDWGIDGIIIVVNGRIVTTIKEVDDLVSTNGFLSVHFVFVQAKNTYSFNAAQLGNSLDGAENIFNDVLGTQPLPPSNEDLNEYRDLIKHIYSLSSTFKDGENPSCSHYYMCRGQYNHSTDFTTKIDKASKAINSMDLTKSFDCKILDWKDIINYYKDTKVKREVELTVEKRLVMPVAEPNSESYLCLIPWKEFKKLLITTSGVLDQSVFNDNIRAFQGLNVVNEAMAASLREGNHALFTAMNNGVTIVSASLHTVGNTIRLKDFQIVNGCQTCNVLFQNMDVDGIDEIVLPVKLISSQNKEIKDKVIVGNNSQTEVKREQLVALLDCQRFIEDYYNEQELYEKLYYERRSKQYLFDNTVPQNKVVTIASQIKAFVAMMMGEPDKVGGYYGRIVKEYNNVGKEIFSPKTEPCYYYTCALADYKMDELFSFKLINKKYKKIKFHVLYAFRLMCEKGHIKGFNSNNSQDYCNHLCSILCDDRRCKEGFEAAITLVDTVLKRAPQDKDRHSSDFTKRLYSTISMVQHAKDTTAVK